MNLSQINNRFTNFLNEFKKPEDIKLLFDFLDLVVQINKENAQKIYGIKKIYKKLKIGKKI